VPTVKLQLALIILIVQSVYAILVTYRLRWVTEDRRSSNDDRVSQSPAPSAMGVPAHPHQRFNPHREGVRLVPRSGEVIRVTRAASVQFASPMLFRVIRVHDWSTYDGWAWLDGYELNTSGDAVDRRSIFVQVSGLQRAHVTLPTRLGGARQPVRAAAAAPGRTAAPPRNDRVPTPIRAGLAAAGASR
jgi:hypothetical protein